MKHCFCLTANTKFPLRCTLSIENVNNTLAGCLDRPPAHAQCVSDPYGCRLASLDVSVRYGCGTQPNNYFR